MPHQVHLRTLGRTADHRLAMLRNLAVAVLRYERVRTTQAKAKEVRRLVDRAIDLGRDGTLVARRRAIALLRDQLIVEKLFTDLRQRFPDRASGFTRLVRLGHRVGDGAPMMLIELVEGRVEQEKGARPAEGEEKEPAGGVARAREVGRRVAQITRRRRDASEEATRTAERTAGKTGRAGAKPGAKAKTTPSAVPAGGDRGKMAEAKARGAEAKSEGKAKAPAKRAMKTTLKKKSDGKENAAPRERKKQERGT